MLPWSRALRRASRPLTRRATSRCFQRLFSDDAIQFPPGQPLYETHPHLLGPGELTPGITAQEYYDRRTNLAKALPKGAIAIIPAADIKYRAGSIAYKAVFHKFYQEPDFFYLTGFTEPDALAIIEKLDDGVDHKFHLYVQPKIPRVELWEGPVSGPHNAMHVFNADEAKDANLLPGILPDLIKRSTGVYTDIPRSIVTRNTLTQYLSGIEPSRLGGLAGILRDAPRGNVKPLRPLMNELRVVKSESEIQNMRRAGQLSGRAITDAMRQNFSNEKDIDSFLDYFFKQDGCDGPAYIPVVAGGQNALTIHYVANNQLLKPEELVLVDAGAEYGGYVTDISRTWPVSGKFTQAQKDLYNTVLNVQRSCVSLCRAEASLTLDKLNKIANERLEEGLKQLGFDVSGDAMDILFPHHVGHYVGVSLHDVPEFPRTRQLEKGMCITMEPGLYIPDDERWPAWARGMGIRIEDSVCVDEGAPLILTTEAVKEVADIEALRD